MSGCSPLQKNRLVAYMSANEGRSDITETAPNRRDWPVSDINQAGDANWPIIALIPGEA